MSILIDVAAEFTGKKAFKQAESATDKLTKSAKNLGKALGISFGTAAVLGYAKASVKAAADDQKAQKQLALALKNVGLERDAASAEGFIQRLQSEFGIVDDKLRPAYQKLAIATRDTAETQRLLNLSLDISAATGKDLDAVTGALSKAYLGNNTALSKLGVGISKADLKTKSFQDITDKLATTFKGAATESANTFAGSMAKLGVASQNVKEIIGKGIIDSLMVLGENTSVSELATDMETAATNAAQLLVTLSKVIKALSTPIVAASGGLAWFIEKTSPIVDFIIAGDPSGILGLKKPPKPFSTPMSISGQVQTPAAKTQLTISKATLKVSKDNLKLAKAKSIFDLQKIQIEAALKGKISEEERIRLKLMQAIENENIDQIDKYTKQLDEAQKKTGELVATLQSIKPLDDIFKNWNFMSVQQQLSTLSSYFNNFAGSAASAFASLGAAQKAALGGYVPFVGATNASLGITSTGGNTTSMPSTVGLGTSGTGNQLPAGVTINTTVQGSVIVENDLNEAINKALAASGWAGTAIGYNRQAVITAI
jgi:hypothetical protein